MRIGDAGESSVWRRMDGESSGEYALFEEYVRHGDLARVAADSGVSLRSVRRYAKVWDWDVRRDALLASGRSIISSPEFFDGVVYDKASQIVAEKLLELGLTTLQLRDPSQIPVELAQSMVKDAVSILKSREHADLTISVNVEKSMETIEALAAEILDEAE